MLAKGAYGLSGLATGIGLVAYMDDLIYSSFRRNMIRPVANIFGARVNTYEPHLLNLNEIQMQAIAEL